MTNRPSGINYYPGANQAQSWITRVNEIAAARSELSTYASIMTPYEYQTISNSIKEKVESSYQMVYQGAKKHLETWTDHYKNVVAQYEKARQNEINGWDSGKLLTETNAFQARLGRELGNKDGLPLYEGEPGALERVKKLYHEAQSSGDKYKQRAAAEIMRSINTEGMERDTVIELRALARKADADLVPLRSTPELQQATDAANKATQDLWREREAVASAGRVMGESVDDPLGAVSAFEKLLKTVQVDRETREIKLYNLTDPEVTGVFWNDRGDKIIEEDNNNV